MKKTKKVSKFAFRAQNKRENTHQAYTMYAPEVIRVFIPPANDGYIYQKP